MQGNSDACLTAAANRATFAEPPRECGSLGYGLLLLFLVFLYSNVALLMPSLEPFRPMLLLAGAAWVAAATEIVLSGRGLLLVWPESYLLLALLAAAGLSSFSALWMRQAVEATADLAKMVAIYFLIVNTVVNEKRLRGVLWSMTLGGLIPTAATLWNYSRGIVQEEGRAAWLGIFGNPNELAYSLAILVPLAIAVSARHAFPVRMMGWGMVALYTVVIFLTYSRGGLVGLLVVLVFLGIRGRSRLTPVVAIVLIASALVFVGAYWNRSEGFSDLESDLSFQQRIATIRAGFEMFLDRPGLGVGLGCFIVAWPLYAPKDLYTRGWLVNHNTLLQVLSETGLAGTIPFVLLFVAALVNSRKLTKVLREKRPHLAAVSGSLEISLYGFLACGLSGGFAVTWFPYILLGLMSSVRASICASSELVPTQGEK
jgi:O-antigen ligase